MIDFNIAPDVLFDRQALPDSDISIYQQKLFYHFIETDVNIDRMRYSLKKFLTEEF
jgi:hypothetical protein